MTPEQQATLDAVKRWLRTRNRPGDGQLCADIDHSALLQRLLAGKDPLPLPPPLSFSYPAYGLIEEGHGETMFVRENRIDDAFCFPGTLSIDQSPQWTILEKRPDGSYRVRCTTNGQTFEVTPGEPLHEHPTWTLRRIEETHDHVHA